MLPSVGWMTFSDEDAGAVETVPAAASGFIPFGRVAHAKYMAVDGRLAWVGTSNWEGNYFRGSRNVDIAIGEDVWLRSQEASIKLGGSVITLMTRDTQMGRGEPIEDVARVITRMVDIVMIRTFEHANLERFASHSRVPVINGLTNEYHPCQILADVFTYVDHRGPIRGKTVAWIGDSNNVCNTWLQAAEIFDFKLNVSTPPGYEIEPSRTSKCSSWTGWWCGGGGEPPGA